ncbi:MAG: putative manganese transporter [Candidatus Hydrogenedentota bacterium]
MIELIRESFNHSIFITVFVFCMMLIVEYINTVTSGIILNRIRTGFSQYIIAGILGIIPGCLGSFVSVTLYAHNQITLGALVCTMIATSGDEAFVMLTLFPVQTIVLHILLFVIGIVAAKTVDYLFKNRSFTDTCCRGLIIHKEEKLIGFAKNQIISNLKHMTLQRGVLIICLSLLALGVLSGYIGEHGGWNWVRVTTLLTSVISLALVTVTPEHFLEEHLWNHIFKEHIAPIFAWTFGALLLSSCLIKTFAIESFISDNVYAVLLLSAVVGIIPESGPHLLFVTLYAKGVLPFAILLCNSIVQDGHAMLPMLSLSRKDFVIIKLINIIVGLLAGMVFLVAQ